MEGDEQLGGKVWSVKVPTLAIFSHHSSGLLLSWMGARWPDLTACLTSITTDFLKLKENVRKGKLI